jgi:hypothetical protein
MELILQIRNAEEGGFSLARWGTRFSPKQTIYFEDADLRSTLLQLHMDLH